MMLKTINMLSLPVQVRADESDKARVARLTQNRDHMAEVKHVILLTLMIFMDMFSMMMLSMLIQAWAALSEEEREGRRAQMRDHNAEVLDNSNHDDSYDDDDGRHVPKFCTLSFVIGEATSGQANRDWLSQEPDSLPVL